MVPYTTITVITNRFIYRVAKKSSSKQIKEMIKHYNIIHWY